MGLFDKLFGKKESKQHDLKEYLNQMEKVLFPNGQLDIDHGVKEVIFISGNKLSKEAATKIFRQSAAIIQIAKPEDRTKERVKQSIEPAYPNVFSDQQYEDLFSYLVARVMSQMMGGTLPKRGQNGAYSW